jgi:hypothetical protein
VDGEFRPASRTFSIQNEAQLGVPVLRAIAFGSARASRGGTDGPERRSYGAISPQAGWHFLRRPGRATPQVGAGWDNGDGTNDATGGCMGREIQERSYRFGRDVMRYAVECESRSVIGRELLRQLFRSATSVGAN